MKIAIYTLTRDRLDYTKHCFNSLRDKAGHQFDHFVIDNGSHDDTQEWIVEEIRSGRLRSIIRLPENKGISVASNLALNRICDLGYDLIIKMDNDCEVISENLLGQIVEIYEDILSKPFNPSYVLSPRVEGINNQPARAAFESHGGRRIGLTGIIGGLFHIVPAKVYKAYLEQGGYPEGLPKAHGQDDNFCHWVLSNGGKLGYIEGLIVNHYEGTDGQAKRYPDYFQRKFKEEKL